MDRRGSPPKRVTSPTWGPRTSMKTGPKLLPQKIIKPNETDLFYKLLNKVVDESKHGRQHTEVLQAAVYLRI